MNLWDTLTAHCVTGFVSLTIKNCLNNFHIFFLPAYSGVKFLGEKRRWLERGKKLSFVQNVIWKWQQMKRKFLQATSLKSFDKWPKKTLPTSYYELPNYSNYSMAITTGRDEKVFLIPRRFFPKNFLLLWILFFWNVLLGKEFFDIKISIAAI